MVCRRPVSDRPQLFKPMIKENFEVHDEDVPRWTRIRSALSNAIGDTSLPLWKALDRLITLEIEREVGTPATEAQGRTKSRLSQEWDIVQFSFPEIDGILGDARKYAYEKDGTSQTYAGDIINESGAFVVTYIADSKSISKCDPRHIMASVIDADGNWERWINKPCNDNFNMDVEKEVWDVIGDFEDWPCPPDRPDPDAVLDQDWRSWWIYGVFVAFPKRYVVVSTGYSALVLSRELYEFMMFYLSLIGEDVGRIPCKNNKLLAQKKDFRPPQIMKNFRFDATNVRALESAVAATGGTLVSYIDELLKTYLGTVVAKRLYDNPPAVGDAQSALRKFNALNTPYGFTVVDHISEVAKSKLNVPALIKMHDEKVMQLERKLREVGRHEEELVHEKARLNATVEEMHYKMDASEKAYRRLAKELSDAKAEAGALGVQLREANDRLQMNLENVGKPEWVDPTGKGRFPTETFPSRQEVADEAYEDAEVQLDKIAKLEATQSKMMEMIQSLMAQGAPNVRHFDPAPPTALPDPADEADEDK